MTEQSRVFTATLLFFVAFYMLLVPLPPYLVALGLADWQVGLVLGAFGVAAAGTAVVLPATTVAGPELVAPEPDGPPLEAARPLDAAGAAGAPAVVALGLAAS